MTASTQPFHNPLDSREKSSSLTPELIVLWLSLFFALSVFFGTIWYLLSLQLAEEYPSHETFHFSCTFFLPLPQSLISKADTLLKCQTACLGFLLHCGNRLSHSSVVTFRREWGQSEFVVVAEKAQLVEAWTNASIITISASECHIWLLVKARVLPWNISGMGEVVR